MNIHNAYYSGIDQSHISPACVIATDDAQAHMLTRQYRAQKLLRICHGVYAKPEIWHNLTFHEQSMQLIHALSTQHPDWIFAGISAATIHRLPHRNWLNRNRQIYITAKPGSYTNAKRPIQHVCTPSNHHIMVDGLKVTPPEQTLADCTGRYGFRDVLAMCDDALRRHMITPANLKATYERTPATGRTRHKATALLRYMSPLSESPGESLCRGTMLEEGFPAPRLQVNHRNKFTSGHTYRTDFEFTALDGDTIIVEFDGAQKYVDPSMTGNRTIRNVVHYEQAREQALANEPGIKRIIRFDYDQVMQRRPVTTALVAAGVPRSSAIPDFAR